MAQILRFTFYMDKYCKNYQDAVIKAANKLSLKVTPTLSTLPPALQDYSGEMVLEIQFIGEVTGSFLMIAKEQVFRSLCSQHSELNSKELFRAFWLDFINIAVQSPLIDISSDFRYLSITAPRLYHAPVAFPDYPESHACVQSDTGNINLHILLDKRKMETMEAYLQAQKANERKSRFLANMSHDIRTPLNAVLGFSQLLEQRKLDESSMSFVKKIRQSSTSLLDLINDILDLSKVEAGKLNLHPAPLSLHDLFHEISQVFSLRVKQKGLGFSFDFENNIPQYLYLDETRIRQVLVNFVSNAIKFTKEGKVSLSAKWLPDKNDPKIGSLALKVQDSGIGVPEELQEKIFIAYEQVNQDKDQYGGTGLGLAISLRLIQMMGGNIHLQSKLGEGSTFIADIPNIKVSKSPSAISESTKIELDCVFSPAKILIVDDIDSNRKIFEAFLEEYPFELRSAKSGMEALEILKEFPAELILLDFKMPGMDGFEVMQHLQNDENLRVIPVIAATASALKEDEDLIRSICEGYLPKPVNKQDLIDELKKHLTCKVLPRSKSTNKPVTKVQFENIIDLKSRCEEVIQPTIAKLKINPSSVNLMLKLTTNLKKLATLYPIKNFVEWQNAIQDACDIYDIGRLEKLILFYDEVLEKLSYD